MQDGTSENLKMQVPPVEYGFILYWVQDFSALRVVFPFNVLDRAMRRNPFVPTPTTSNAICNQEMIRHMQIIKGPLFTDGGEPNKITDYII